MQNILGKFSCGVKVKIGDSRKWMCISPKQRDEFGEADIWCFLEKRL